MDAPVLRARVARVDVDGEVWVEVFELGQNYTFGPCQRVTDLPMSVNDRVLVTRVSGVLEDIVVLGPLDPDTIDPDSAVIPDGSITDVKIASANKDGLATVPGLRTLGSGAQQAAPGNHLHDDRYYTESESNTLLATKAPLPQTYSFAVASTLWVATHPFSKKPVDVTLADANGTVIEADVTFPDVNTVHVSFYYPTTGSMIVRP